VSKLFRFTTLRHKSCCFINFEVEKRGIGGLSLRQLTRTFLEQFVEFSACQTEIALDECAENRRNYAKFDKLPALTQCSASNPKTPRIPTRQTNQNVNKTFTADAERVINKLEVHRPRPPGNFQPQNQSYVTRYF
jgi:hypothetical protein